jgi:hypothetical protein
MPVIRFVRPARLALVTAAFAACGGRAEAPTAAAVVVAGVRAQQANGAIRLTNDTDAPIAYAAIEREAWTHMLASWGPCPKLADCTIEPGQTAVIPYEQIGMYTPAAREAVVVYWRVVSRDPAYELIDDPVDFVVRL